MPFQIIRHNIAEVDAECIINTTSLTPDIRGGSDLTIHRYAGKKLIEARRQFGVMSVGDVHITKGYKLKAEYVIHMAAPTWYDDDAEKKLRECYDKAFALADDYQIKTLAFPLVGAGTYHFPPEIALKIALDAVSDFCLTHTMDLILVVFDKKVFKLSQQLHSSVQSFIDENFVDDLVRYEYEKAASNIIINHSIRQKAPRRGARKAETKDRLNEAKTFSYASHSVFDDDEAIETTAVSIEELNLDDLLQKREESFSDALLNLIDRRHLTDAYVYKKANIDRKLFHKIKIHPDYQPRKTTCLAFAIALELNLDETIDFISHAGYALSHSSKLDIIVEYFIRQKKYNIYEINTVLFEYDCPLLGSK